MKKFRALLFTALIGLAGLGFLSYEKASAASPIQLGGSIFPLTLVTVPVTNLADAFNEMLMLINAQVAGLDTVYTGTLSEPGTGTNVSNTAFSTLFYGNPLALQTEIRLTASAAMNPQTQGFVIASAAGRTIYPSAVVIMASGTPSNAENFVIKCTNGSSDTAIVTYNNASIADQVPVAAAYVSGAGVNTRAVTLGAGIGSGCPAGYAVVASQNGSVQTTSHYFVNMIYTVQ